MQADSLAHLMDHASPRLSYESDDSVWRPRAAGSVHPDKRERAVAPKHHRP